MMKRLERQKIQAAFANMRDAGIKSFAFFIFGYPGETPQTMDATTSMRSSLIRTSRTSIRPSRIRGPSSTKGVREGLLAAEDADWSRMEYSYYLLRGNGLDEPVVMDAINRARRRFFLRPAYITRHFGDVSRLAMTKQCIVWQVLSSTVLGARTIDTSVARPPSIPADGLTRQ